MGCWQCWTYHEEFHIDAGTTLGVYQLQTDADLFNFCIFYSKNKGKFLRDRSAKLEWWEIMLDLPPTQFKQASANTSTIKPGMHQKSDNRKLCKLHKSKADSCKIVAPDKYINYRKSGRTMVKANNCKQWRRSEKGTHPMCQFLGFCYHYLLPYRSPHLR